MVPLIGCGVLHATDSVCHRYDEGAGAITSTDCAMLESQSFRKGSTRTGRYPAFAGKERTFKENFTRQDAAILNILRGCEAAT